ncbi:MAG: DUF5675 family protein [Bacteroidota bacterium]
MKRFVFLTLLVVGIVAILLFIYNPDLLERIWLWIVGLFGFIVFVIKSLVDGITNLFRRDETKVEKENKPDSSSLSDQTTHLPSLDSSLSQLYKDKIGALEDKIRMLEEQQSLTDIDYFKGTTLTVLRYYDNGETTLGLLFIDDKYFCYTLEDTFREVKVKGKTRIPRGTYTLDFNRQDTPLTLRYRKTRPWFHYHLHVKNVKGFERIYIHSGSTHEHTEGCLLVAKSIHANSAQKIIYNSKVTFEELYKKLKKRLDNGERIRIKYYDEDFLSSFESLNKAS